MGLELKKETVEITKKKSGQLKTHLPSEVVAKPQSRAPKKGNAHTPFSKAHKKSPGVIKEKSIPDNLTLRKTGDTKNSTKPDKVVQPE